tara:strand:- start:163 stop:339 length:177 start_codon:yes stop_codon:yes gene_type:complete
MSITTEQEAINQFWPNDNTKTIEDLINVWINDFNMSREDSINTIKNISDFSNVTNWSV